MIDPFFVTLTVAFSGIHQYAGRPLLFIRLMAIFRMDIAFFRHSSKLPDGYYTTFVLRYP